MKETLKKLATAYDISHINEARQIAKEMLSKYAEVWEDNSGVFAKIKGKSDYTILLDAHIDEIGMVVTHITDDGFVKAAKAGGVDVRVLPASMVKIHGKEKINAICATMPPHLADKQSDIHSDIDELYFDTGLMEKAKDIIRVGDFITYKPDFIELQNGKISCKSLDNRAGCAVLANICEKLKNPPVTVIIMLSTAEELGCRGAKTGAYNFIPDECITIDVSYALSPGTPEHKCGKMGDGAMIGISPVLCKDISDKLIITAKKNNIKYQFEPMGGVTGTNADMISVSKTGVKTGLISIPLRYMHTPVETAALSDMEAVRDLIIKYVEAGGV